MSDPVILVTGSTDGIGKATAAALTVRGAEIILHGRDAGKGAGVQKELLEKSEYGKPDLVIADFSDQGQIRRMAEDIASRYTRLDVLINNAGTYIKSRELTCDGIERTFAVNYLGPFLLTHLLLPVIRKGSPSRIVTVASSAHEDVNQIPWENLPSLDRYDPWEVYSLSKFADVTFTYSLARNLKRTGVTANCLHPGIVNTKILRSAFPNMPAILPKEGAKTSLYLALSPSVAGISGQYFENQKLARSSRLSHNRKVQERLWKMAEGLTGLAEDK